jgi:hypothetical protein
LQTGRPVGGLTDNSAFLELPRADEIADQAGRNADAYPERLLDARLADRLDQRQAGPNRPLGIVLVHPVGSRNTYGFLTLCC